jgi:hypothetical protein
MPKFPSASDVITFDLNTGGNSAGNGGDGYNKGTLTNVQNASFEPSNKADGSHVDVKTGDYVNQKAGWDAGGATIKNSGDGSARADGADVDIKQKAAADGGGAKLKGGKTKAKADGSDGDISQKADSDAGGAKIKDSGNGHADADAESNGSQKSTSGYDTSKVSADTTAHQENWAKFNQTANLIAGNGGDGGNNNTAKGGEVSFELKHSEVQSTDLSVKDAFNHSTHFDVSDFLHG